MNTDKKLSSLYRSLIIWILFVICHLSFVITFSYAEKVTILYTGETHATLYTCKSCPVSSALGGVAKRATKINEALRQNPNTLLVDSGAVFAGGILDEHTLNVDLDKERTRLNLEAMRQMGYDAVALGDEEFNFGEDFLRSAIKEKGLTFISSNISADYVLPFTRKIVGGIEIGILAVTSREVKNKISGISYIDPQEALARNIGILRGSGTDIIVVLAHVDEEEAMELINKVGGIDVLVTGHRLSNDLKLNAKIGDTIVLRPVWQGRELGKADLEIENKKIANFTVNNIAIEEQTNDDAKISGILPECFCDNDCQKKGVSGACSNAAKASAKCVFAKIKPVDVTVIRPKDCRNCDIEKSLNQLKVGLGDLKVSYLDHDTGRAKELLGKWDIKMLPAYIFNKEDVEKNKNFNRLKKSLILKDDKYLLDPAVLGVSFFSGRGRKEKNLDLFISLSDKNAYELLDMLKGFLAEHREIKFNLHFLGLIKEEEGKEDKEKKEQKITTPYGLAEFEEDLRSVCVMKNYPDKWWDYLACRAKNVQSSWWDNCLEANGMNVNLIKECAMSGEGRNLLLANMALSSELAINASGTFLSDNQDVFSTLRVPKKEELERIIK